jgi:hypothetical protein
MKLNKLEAELYIRERAMMPLPFSFCQRAVFGVNWNKWRCVIIAFNKTIMGEIIL